MAGSRQRRSAAAAVGATSHHPRCSLKLALAAAAMALFARSAEAARNVTIAASDTSINYSPSSAWSRRDGQSANVGDGTARVATQNGATASLTFTGTAIYFQTVRSPQHGVATINLDGADFKIDSSGSAGNSGDTGVVWGIVSLKDTTHKITVTQSQTTGVEVSINAFIYTSTEDGPLAPDGQDTSPLSPSNSNFARNTALIAVFAGLLAFCLGILAFWLVKRCKSKRHSQASIALESSPITPLSLGGKHASVSSSSHITRSGSQRSQMRQEPQVNVRRATPPALEQQAAVVALQPTDADAIRQARTLHALQTETSSEQHESPYSGLSSSSANSGRALLSSSNERNATMDEHSVPMSWRSSGQSPPNTESSSSSSRSIRRVAAAEPAEESLQDPLEDDKQAELARRLREAGSLTSSHLPAGFSVVRPPSPPPAYAERLTRQYAEASAAAASGSIPRGSLAKSGSGR